MSQSWLFLNRKENQGQAKMDIENYKMFYVNIMLTTKQTPTLYMQKAMRRK